MTATRRDFLKAATVTSGVVMAGAPIVMAGTPTLAVAETKPKQSRHIGVGLQLFSVRDDCGKDFDRTLAKVAAMGITGVEFAGYHKYSEDAAGLKKQLDANGLKAIASFFGTANLQGDALKQTVEYAKTIGCKVLTVGGDGDFINDAGNQRLADIFNKAAQTLKPLGMFCGYHNHASEMAIASGGKTWWELFADRTSKDVVLHCDVAWVAHGGQDPVDMLRKFPGRSKAIHAKPFVKHGEAGERDFIGHDSLDWKGIIAACYEVGGTEWFSIEQEAYPEGKSAMQCADISIKGLKAILADTKYGKLYYA